MLGFTGWADIHPPLPSPLNGLGVEFEYRDVNWNQGSQHPPNFRQRTLGGGPAYTWPRYRNLRPYAKALLAYGSMDFTIPELPSYTHDSRTVYVFGGGLQQRIHNRLWFRLDYEYQIWQPMFSGVNRPTPSGFTLGATYQVGSSGRPL
jgi:hypothetical protein